jgi:regulator of protease activity HflC (stomatin/prohibitin superfamily)
LSAKNSLNNNFSRILLYYEVGADFLAGLAILCGIWGSLYNVVQFGILQLFLMILIFMIMNIQKLAMLANESSERGKNIASEIDSDQDSDDAGISAAEIKRDYQVFRQIYYPLTLLIAAIVGIIVELIIVYHLTKIGSLNRPPLLIGILSMVVSFAFLISSNLFGNNAENGPEYPMLGYFYQAGQWVAFVSGLSIILGYVGFGLVEPWLGYAIAGFLILVFIDVLFQCVIRLLYRDQNYSVALNLAILPVLLSGGNPMKSLLNTLENTAGISFRSTWTVKFIRKNTILLIFIVMLFFWLMTSFVQINPDEKGILYSLGKIKNSRPVLPGIHLKLPWPIQIVKIYPAYKISNFTVGYEANKQGNYLWTRNHSGEEYKLLLGDGKELVSINMQVSYKIGDLNDYVLQYDNPEEKLKAEAYRILLYETVTTNLDNLLSRNRSSFAAMIEKKLQEVCEAQHLGLEVMGVALANIHPPIEIAREYQSIVSANIQKEKIIIEATAYADSSIPQAEKIKNETIKNAEVEALIRKGQANSEAEQYLYQWRAYQINNSAYTQWKWLDVLENSLNGKDLYLIDKKLNMQKGSIWFDMRALTGNKVKEGASSNVERGI